MLDIAPHEVPQIAGSIYRVEGDWDVSDFLIIQIVHHKVAATENILVVATGRRSGEQMSGRGHHRSLEVIPANENARRLFESTEPRWVPSYLLHNITQEDLLR